MSILLILLALLLIAATLIPLSSSRHWYVRAFDFPRLQISVLCVLWLVLWVIYAQPSGYAMNFFTVAIAAVLAYQLYWIVPNTQLNNVEIEPHVQSHQASLASIRILSSNVLMHNRRAEALLTLVHKHQPDILITLESDQWWQDQLDVLDSYPHRMACPLDNLYGMHLYSRFELCNPTIEYLVENDKPSMSAQVKINEQQNVQLHVVHPAPPAPAENEESTERDVELISIARSVAERTTPVIVAGDLNDVAWSATTRLFREISGLKDPRVGRGMFNTFNARHWYVRWPLDHVFVSEHFKLVSMSRLPDIGSDHFPLLVELALVQTHIASGSGTSEPTEPSLLDQIEDTDVAKQAHSPTQT